MNRMNGAYTRGAFKIYVAPATLVKLFGRPSDSTYGFLHSTGEYHFEDSNLDCFCLFDLKKTTHFHGPNREDEWYERKLNMSKAPHKRKRKWPTVDEFWNSTEPVDFRVTADDYSKWRKFRRWLRIQIRNSDSLNENYDDMVLAKYGKELDICLADYDEKGVVNHDDIAVFKYDFTQIMNKEQHDEYVKKLNKAIEDGKPAPGEENGPI